MLISLAMKLCSRMIMNRWRPALDTLPSNPQNWFRRKGTTIGQRVALRHLLEAVRSNNLSSVLTFIDFEKAFDTIHHGKLMEILPAYGVPEQLVAAITATYSETWAKVRTPDGDTFSFQYIFLITNYNVNSKHLRMLVLPEAIFENIDHGKFLKFKMKNFHDSALIWQIYNVYLHTHTHTYTQIHI